MITPPPAVGFVEDWTLLALLLGIPLIAFYVYREQAARRGRAQFTNPALLPAVAPRRPRWRRHVAPVLMLIALAALVIAAARPQITVGVPREDGVAVLVIDRSGSMAATDVSPTRLDAARASAQRFTDRVPKGVRVGAVAFNGKIEGIAAPGSEKAGVINALERLTPAGGTATGEALDLGLKLARQARGRNRRTPATIVLLTDGKSDRGRDPVAIAREAKRLRVKVHTISLGTDEGTITSRNRRTGRVTRERVPPDRETLETVARVTDGRYFDAEDADKLDEVYEELSTEVGERKDTRELTRMFAGGGLIAVLLASGLSLAWFGRPLP